MNLPNPPNPPDPPSVNRNVLPLLAQLREQAESLGVLRRRLDNDCELFDAGIDEPGSIEAGQLIAEICLAGLARLAREKSRDHAHCDWILRLSTDMPVLACLASQYAGWRLEHGEGKQAFRALGSGPGRALGSPEKLFAELQYRDQCAQACLVMETDRIPPLALIDALARSCRVRASQLSLILTPTTSICGVVQVAARVLETALHKMHVLGAPLQGIVSGAGQVPVCPVSSDLVTGMGCTNDAILFGGEVWLDIDAPDAQLRELAEKLPSTASRDYGKPFAEVFKAANHDFYRIDPLLFAPALVHLKSVGSGQLFSAGRINRTLLQQSFAQAAGAG